MQQEYFTLGRAAEILAVKPYVLTYLLATKKVAEPARVGGRRMFTASDLAKISEYLKVSAGRDGYVRQ
jgi:DNA-binding transcriptional MerR regulator